jgi:NADPH2:quinone reductase
VRVDVYTCGVTASDILICQGVYDVQPKLPFTPGFEAFWEVKEVASDVVSVRHGERVIGLKKEKYSGFAEESVIRHVILQQDFRVVPQAMKFEIGASLIDTYGTALLGL